jgi:hypothetical protein
MNIRNNREFCDSRMKSSNRRILILLEPQNWQHHFILQTTDTKFKL